MDYVPTSEGGMSLWLDMSLEYNGVKSLSEQSMKCVGHSGKTSIIEKAYHYEKEILLCWYRREREESWLPSGGDHLS